MSVRIMVGVAAAVLRHSIAPRSVDMVYVDPPFGTGRIWSGKAGSFDDRWRWDAAAEARLTHLRADGAGMLVDILQAAAVTPAGRGYLASMAELLMAVRPTLKLTGTVWLHCDPTFGAYLRLIGDLLFLGRGEVVWRRTAAHNQAANKYPEVHDNIFIFARSRAADVRLARVRGAGPPDPEIDVHGDPLVDGVRVAGLVRNELLTATSAERCDYPTQKPLGLLRRLISLATLPGDLVLDPCCGSGTSLVAALRIGRCGIGIDQSADAVRLTERRIAAETRQGDLFARVA